MQVSRLVRETPEVYEKVVKPYVDSISPSSISWVYNILDGTAEAENVLHRDDDPETGFVLTPDLCVAVFSSLSKRLQKSNPRLPVPPRRKWDQKTMSALYLLVLTQDRSIRSLRDLRARHLPLLRNIRTECERVAREKYGLDTGELRFFVHYQPTYCAFSPSVISRRARKVAGSMLTMLTCDNMSADHFHVHVVSSSSAWSLGPPRPRLQKLSALPLAGPPLLCVLQRHHGRASAPPRRRNRHARARTRSDASRRTDSAPELVRAENLHLLARRRTPSVRSPDSYGLCIRAAVASQ